jgi:protein PhnA
MSIDKELTKRANGCCELCGATNDLKGFAVEPLQHNGRVDDYALLCSVCTDQLAGNQDIDNNHWRCLNDSMWSEVSAVQVLAWRMLHRIKGETWSNDLLEMLYLDDDTLAWAKANGDDQDENVDFHKDVNGVRILAGDSVVLIKDLNVKGGGFTAKRGTAVRNVSLDHNNTNYIEGKVNGQTIVIITEYVKKS